MLVIGWATVPPSLCMAAYLIRRKRTGGSAAVSAHAPTRLFSHWHAAYAFLAVAFGWSTLFLFYPLAKSLIYSFTDKSMDVQSGTQWVGLDNYARIIADPLWWKSVAVTSIYIAGTIPYSVLMSLFLASLIVSLPAFWQTFFKAALYLPGVISVVVSAAITKWIFYPGDGFANMLLTRLHLISENLTWFADPNLALPTLIVIGWLSTNGIGVIIYCAALGNIPRSYYEAADIDGATAYHKFLRITWPLAKPSTVYVLITGMIGGFQIFAPALLITGGGPQYTTYFVNYRIYQAFYHENQFGLACAMSVVLMAIIVLIAVINYRFLATDVEY